MANYSVSDILGVGFKYIQTAEDQIAPIPTGTIAAIFGTATWGPIGVTTFINGGNTDFQDRFGFAGTTQDEGWDAMYHHLQSSSLGYFTRIASTNNPPKRSYKEVSNNATSAFITGTTTLGENLRIYPSNYASPNHLLNLQVTHKTSIMPTSEQVNLSINFQTEGLVSQGGLIQGNFSGTNYTLSTGDDIQFKIYNNDSVVGTYNFVASGGEVVSGAQSFVNLLLSQSTIASGAAQHFSLTASGTTVTLTTEPYYYGPTSRVEIVSNDCGILSVGNDYGSDVSRSSVLSLINNKFKALTTSSTAYNGQTLGNIYGDSLTIVTLNTDSKAVFTAPSTGTTSIITNPTINTLFGLSNSQSSTGINSKVIGSFRAKRRGTEGNLITLIFTNTASTERKCEIIFRGKSILTAVGYDFVTGSSDNLSDIISTSLPNILEYNHGKTYSDFDEPDDSLSVGESISGITSSDVIGDGIYTLQGGTNGEDINVSTDLIPLIKAVNNEDIYDFDLIATPGYPEQAVQQAMLDDVCDYRKDCFAILDIPDFGNPAAAVDRVINWTNGKHISRSIRLNSIYGAVYFPHIIFEKTIYDSNMEKVSATVSKSATSRIVGMIANGDLITTTKFSAPAGITRGKLAGTIIGVKQSLTAEQRDKLYADVYDNCINPIISTLANGIYVNGQKTTLRKNSRGNLTALSRINVMRVGLYIKKEVARIVPNFFHQPNDSRSQREFQVLLSGILTRLVNFRAIEANFVAICDSTTNPPEVTNNNGLIAVIEFTPVKTIERIKLFANIKERRSSVTVA